MQARSMRTAKQFCCPVQHAVTAQTEKIPPLQAQQVQPGHEESKVNAAIQAREVNKEFLGFPDLKVREERLARPAPAAKQYAGRKAIRASKVSLAQEGQPDQSMQQSSRRSRQ